MNYAWPRAGKAALAMTALLALVLAGADACARNGGGGGHSGRGGSHSGSHHGHHHGYPHSSYGGSGVFFGGFFGSYWAYPAYWYAQSTPYLPAGPVYYIERSEEELRASSIWYYCESEAAYYPYVAQCPAGWVGVEPFAVP